MSWGLGEGWVWGGGQYLSVAVYTIVHASFKLDVMMLMLSVGMMTHRSDAFDLASLKHIH